MRRKAWENGVNERKRESHSVWDGSPLCISMNDFMDLLQSAGRLGREEADFPLQNPWGVAIIK